MLEKQSGNAGDTHIGTGLWSAEERGLPRGTQERVCGLPPAKCSMRLGWSFPGEERPGANICLHFLKKQSSLGLSCCIPTSPNPIPKKILLNFPHDSSLSILTNQSQLRNIAIQKQPLAEHVYHLCPWTSYHFVLVLVYNSQNGIQCKKKLKTVIKRFPLPQLLFLQPLNENPG